jgi:hypothetical protein
MISREQGEEIQIKVGPAIVTNGKQTEEEK